MPHRTLIRGAAVVLPDETARTSVLIEGGRIVGVGAPAGVRADEVLDADGLHLLPGVIDDQVHFRDPGLTHKEDLRTGSRACAAGGVTSFLEMPNTIPQTVAVEALAGKLALAARRSVVNYGFYMGATTGNLEELERASGPPWARRTPGIKIFIGSSTGNMLVDDQEALEAIFAETTLPIAAHCEDEATVRANHARLTAPGSPPLTVHDHSRIRDHRAAVKATRRAIDLAIRHRRRFHVLHVSTAEEVEVLGGVRREWLARHQEWLPDRMAEDESGGASPRDVTSASARTPSWIDGGSGDRPLITSEACPHHLFLDTSDYDRLGTLAQMNPSLKTAEDRAALWDGLASGAIDILATDHAPHTLEEKAAPYPASPSGVPAVEVFLPLMLNAVNRGRCTLGDLARWMCDGPARIWDIAGKGRIEPGMDADLVLADMAMEREVRNEEQLARCGWSPWHGTTLQGWPVRTWVGGRTVFAGRTHRDSGKVAREPLGREIEFDRTE